MLFLDEPSVRDVERDVERWAALWREDRPGPDGPEALDRMLGIGIAADDRVEALAKRIRDGIDASGGRVVYDLESARAVERLTKAWLAPASRVAGAIADVQRAGLTIQQLAAYHDRVIDARFGISVPVEQAAIDAEGWARHDVGRHVTTEELKDAVPSRVG